MFNILSDDLLLFIFSHTSYNISLLIALTCKRFYKTLKKKYNKQLQFNILEPEKECLYNSLELLIYSHKNQIKKNNQKKIKKLFNLWHNATLIDFALNNNYRACLTYALNNNLFTFDIYIHELYIKAALKYGNLDDLKYLDNKLYLKDFEYICIENSCRFNRLGLLYYFNTINIKDYKYEHFLLTIREGNLECLKFMSTNVNFSFEFKKMMIITAVDNHKIDCLDFILSLKEPDKEVNINSKYNRNTAEAAAYLATRIDSLDSLKTIYDEDYKFNIDKCIYISTQHKSFECLGYLLDIQNDEYLDKLEEIIDNHKDFGRWKPITAVNCAKYGYLEGLKYIVENYLEYDYDRCLKISEENDNQNCVEYLLNLG